MKSTIDESDQLQAQLALETIKSSQQSLRAEKIAPIPIAILGLTIAGYAFFLIMPGIDLPTLVGGIGTVFALSLAFLFWGIRKGNPQFYPTRPLGSPLKTTLFSLLVGCIAGTWIFSGLMLVGVYGQPMRWFWALLTGVLVCVAWVIHNRKNQRYFDAQGVVSSTEQLATRASSKRYFKEQARHIFFRYTLGLGAVISALLAILPLYIYLNGRPIDAIPLWMLVLSILYLGPVFGTLIGVIRSIFVAQKRYMASQRERNVAHER